MRRIRLVRKRIFVGAEGEGEQGFARWLGSLTEQLGLHLYLDVVVLGGGDSLVMVQEAIRRRRVGVEKGRYVHSLLLLDEDRLLSDGQRAERAVALASREGFTLIRQRPKLEGILLRLHEGHENRLDVGDADRELRRVWLDYSKPAIADDLARRFALERLLAAARFDDQLARLLTLLELR